MERREPQKGVKPGGKDHWEQLRSCLSHISSHFSKAHYNLFFLIVNLKMSSSSRITPVSNMPSNSIYNEYQGNTICKIYFGDTIKMAE